MHILLVGSGAVGTFYASKLPKSTSVEVVCRSNYAAVVAQGGFRIQSPLGNRLFVPTAIHRSIQEADQKSREKGTPFDFILVATKALPDVTDLSKELEPLCRDCVTIVLIQNGIGIESPYAARFPHCCILSAVTAISSAQTEPGLIVHHRWTRIQLGPFPTTINEDQGRAKAVLLAKLFREGGIRDAFAHSAKDLQMIRWHKLAINASFSPSAILSGGLGNAELALDPIGEAHIRACMQEVFDTAVHIFGSPFPEECASIDAILTSTRRNVGSKPSMLMDWESGLPLEIQVILGNPIAEAHRHGIPMPRLETLYNLLRLQLQSRKQLAASKAKI